MTKIVQKNALRILEERGITKTGFAREIGLPESTVLGWFNRPTISLATIEKLVKYLGVSASELFKEERC
jgi:transcriptional regulator with XRE-family HTH domain